MTDQESLEFQYRPSRIKAIGLVLVMCLGVCLFVWIALFADNIPPAVVCGIQLNAAQTKVLYSAIASLSSVAVVLMFLLIICSFCRKGRVIFEVDSVTLPKPNWLGIPVKRITLRYDQIVSVERRRFVGKELMLRIVHRSGKACLFSNMFPKRQDFEMVAEILSRLSPSGRGEPSADSRN